MRFSIIIFCIVLFDQLLKQFLLSVLDKPLWFFRNDVGLELVFNEGIAFSLPIRGIFAVVLSITIIAVILIFVLRMREKNFYTDLVFGFIIGGGVANIIDRIHYGFVVDYFRFFSFPHFNLADTAVTLGFLLLIVFFYRMKLE